MLNIASRARSQLPLYAPTIPGTGATDQGLSLPHKLQVCQYLLAGWVGYLYISDALGLVENQHSAHSAQRQHERREGHSYHAPADAAKSAGLCRFSGQADHQTPTFG